MEAIWVPYFLWRSADFSASSFWRADRFGDFSFDGLNECGIGGVEDILLSGITADLLDEFLSVMRVVGGGFDVGGRLFGVCTFGRWGRGV